MKEYVVVGEDLIAAPKDLTEWVEASIAYAQEPAGDDSEEVKQDLGYGTIQSMGFFWPESVIY